LHKALNTTFKASSDKILNILAGGEPDFLIRKVQELLLVISVGILTLIKVILDLGRDNIIIRPLIYKVAP
jgi:hypothetical protein